MPSEAPPLPHYPVHRTRGWGHPTHRFLKWLRNNKVDKADLPINVRDYGAIGDGVSDDTAALASWRDAVIAASSGNGNVAGYLPPGTYRTTAPISFGGTGVPVTVFGAGATQTFLYGDFVGAGSGILDISNTNADSYSTRGHRISGIGFLGNGVPGDPIGLKALNAYEHVVNDIDAPVEGGVVLANSVVVVTNDNNSKWNLIRGQAGFQPQAFDTAAATASITAASTAVTLSASVATASWVGKTIYFASGSDTGSNAFWKATITAQTGSGLTLDTPAPSTAAGVKFSIGLVTGTVASGSTTLTINNIVGLTSAWVGMQVHVLGGSVKTDAGSTLGVLSTRIASVAGSVITLEQPATAAVTNGVVLFAPNVFLGSFEGDPASRQTNHSWWNNTHCEGYQAAGLIANKVIYASFDNLKLHGAAPEYAPDWGQSYHAAVLSEIKTLKIDQVQVENTVAGSPIHVSGSRGLLTLNDIEFGKLWKDEPAVRVVTATDEFRVTHGNITVVYALTNFSSTYSLFSSPRADHVEGRGLVQHRNKAGTLAKAQPVVTHGVTSQHGNISIADDAVRSFKPVGSYGVLHFAASAADAVGIIHFRTSANAGGAYAKVLAGNTALIDALTTATTLTGVTGTDGKVTVAADASGNLQIENRRGFALTFAILFGPLGV